LRLRKGYYRDAHGRPTLKDWGRNRLYMSPAGFDGADNLVGIGAPYNSPPYWCRNASTGELSKLCSQLSYNRANRLTSVDIHLETAAVPGAQRTMFQHDAHGNINAIKHGCSENDTFWSCEGAELDYIHDDFGQLVLWKSSNGGGDTSAAFDAAGNLTFFQDAVMRSEGVSVHQRRTYDGLGRLLALESMRGRATEALLFGFDYDGIASPPLG